MRTLGTIAGLAGGTASALLGGLLVLASWLSVDSGTKHWLSKAATVALLLTIPLIILGAFCLDLIERTSHPQPARPIDSDADTESRRES